MGIFYCARHGLTKDDMPDHDCVTGWLEVPINAEGRVNAQRAARWLRNRNITSITTSDLLRTKQTAKIIGEELGIPLFESDKLRSWNMGSLQGMLHTVAEPFLTFFQKNPEIAPPRGEAFNKFYARFKQAWDGTVAYVRKFPNAHPLLVTHSQNLDIANWFIKGITPGKALEFGNGIPPGGVLEVRIDGDKITIRKVRV